MSKPLGMERCQHGLETTWCYLCRVDRSASPRAAWGLDDEPPEDWVFSKEPMGEAQADYLRFLCEEFGYSFEPDLAAGEADILIESFLEEPMTEQQRATLVALTTDVGESLPEGLSYAGARRQIRTLVTRRALGRIA
ncbi:MAG: hypothetical protein QOE83_91 [Actinomycetota bacterium]|nr:hypothetical protein [Actinomycetota bacterium]